MYNKFLSFILKEIRNMLSLTQKEFGNQIGKSEISIRKYEKGDNNIPYEVLYLIISYFKIDFFKMGEIIKKCKNNILELKILTEEELNDCLVLFAEDLIKIYQLSPVEPTDVPNDFNQLEKELKKILGDYIIGYLTIVFKNELKKGKSLKSPTDEIKNIQNEIIGYLNYSIENKIIKVKDKFLIDSSNIFSQD